MSHGSRVERALAWLCAPALLVTSASISSPARWGFAIAQGITLSWLVMLGVAVADHWRTRRR